MSRFALCALLAALSSGALAQTDQSVRRHSALAAVSFGTGNDGLALSLSAGPNLGWMTPQAFVAYTASEWDGETASRGTAGVVGRLAVDPPGGRFDIAATAGAAYAFARRPSQVFAADGVRGRTLSYDGVAAVMGLEVTRWLTRGVGVSVSAHQNIPLIKLSRTNSEVFPVDNGPGTPPAVGVLVGPGIDQWGLGVGLRFGRQQ